jgi:hypothetical protein
MACTSGKKVLFKPYIDEAYAKLGAPAGCMNYFVWRSDRLATAACPPTEASIEMLGQSLLRATNAL